METKVLTCIGCPKGCQVTVHMNGDVIEDITGYCCKRGDKYARHEVVSPTRVLTTTVMLADGVRKTVPVKTSDEVPKDKIFDCITALQDLVVQAPVTAGDVVLANISGTGVSVIATCTVQ